MKRQCPNLLERSKAATRKRSIFGHLRNYMANDRLGGAWRIEDTPTLVTLFICSALSLALFLSTLDVGRQQRGESLKYPTLPAIEGPIVPPGRPPSLFQKPFLFFGCRGFNWV